MTKEEFQEVVQGELDKGFTIEDVMKKTAILFQNGDLDRDEFEAITEALGFELEDELKGMSDEELRKAIIHKKDDATDDDEPKDEPKDDEPKADDAKEGDDDGEDEKSKAMKLFGLGK